MEEPVVAFEAASEVASMVAASKEQPMGYREVA